MSTQIILLERVEKLGEMGDVVAVKPGYARNFLLPQKRALRATKNNIAYFEAQKKILLAESNKKKTEAQKLAKKLSGLKVPLIRAASESGHLYGSVTSRDIAQGVATESKETINRTQVDINQNFKMVGLFLVDIVLHPEVKVSVTINIARTVEEAEIQAKTGKALVADDDSQNQEDAVPEANVTEQLEDVLEDDALEAEKEKQAEAEEQAALDAEKAVAKEEAKVAKAAVKAEVECNKDAPAEEKPPVEDAI